jgi:copper(I)-binding protein
MLIVMAVAFGPAWAGADVVVSDPWIREAPPGAPALAGYMELKNRGNAEAALVSVHAAGFGSAMIHRTVYESGLARMVHVDAVQLPPGATVRFAPGGYHLMLMSPSAAVHSGDRVEIVLEFSDGQKRPVQFEVRPAGAGVREHGSD